MGSMNWHCYVSILYSMSKCGGTMSTDVSVFDHLEVREPLIQKNEGNIYPVESAKMFDSKEAAES